MLKNEGYFLARYDTKTDECLGVYNDIEEAIKLVYGYDKNHQKYETAKKSIIASYKKMKRTDNSIRSAHGNWYKFKLN